MRYKKNKKTTYTKSINHRWGNKQKQNDKRKYKDNYSKLSRG